MKQAETKEIDVLLTVMGDSDVLVFNLDTEDPDKYVIDLNDTAGQVKIKEVFSKLLEMLLNEKLTLRFRIAEGYSKELYKDVCSEYIEELNTEIEQVIESVKYALK